MVDKIFYNGNILTQNKKQPSAQAFATLGNKFAAVGDNITILNLKNDHTELINLNGKTVLPGFNDAHIHIWKVGNLLTHLLDLRGVKSIDEMLDLLSDYYKKKPHLEWIQARGFNEIYFDDKRIPNKLDIDKVIAHKPVCITRTCAHQIIVNSKALEVAKITSNTSTPKGGEIKVFPNGELAGHFTETAIGLILNAIPKYTSSQFKDMIHAAQEALLKYGITSATDPAVEHALIKVYKEMDAEKSLKIRVSAFPIRVPDGVNTVYALPEKYDSEHLTIDTVKFFADGGLSGQTAALKTSYKNSNNKGVLRLDFDLFYQLALESQNAGFRIATHAIGDAAIEMVLKIYASIAHKNTTHINHRIEHVGLPSHADLQCMKDLSISAIMQPIFMLELGKNFQQYLDDDYLKKVYPLKSILHYPINVALSTDAPVVKNFNPFINILSAIDRKDSAGEIQNNDECISLDECIYAYTMGGAIVNGKQKTIGSIETNKFADFILLDLPLAINTLSSQKILETYINGVKYFSLY